MHFLKIIGFSVVAVVLLPTMSQGQKITLVNSTEQCWSGGVAGSHGCNYTFSIQFAKAKPMPDTLWIGNQPIALEERTPKNKQGGNMKVTYKKNKTQFEIAGSTRFNDARDRNQPHPMGDAPNAPEAVPPKKYSGVALLSYTYKGKRCYYEVKRIMHKQPPVFYP